MTTKRVIKKFVGFIILLFLGSFLTTLMVLATGFNPNTGVFEPIQGILITAILYGVAGLFVGLIILGLNLVSGE